MVIINGSSDKEKRKMLRKSETPEEKFAWKVLRAGKSGLKWRRQVSIGKYVADFYCGSKRTALELDGAHHLSEKNKEYDAIRDAFFRANNIKVIRISNKDLNKDPAILYAKIKELLA